MLNQIKRVAKNKSNYFHVFSVILSENQFQGLLWQEKPSALRVTWSGQPRLVSTLTDSRFCGVARVPGRHASLHGRRWPQVARPERRPSTSHAKQHPHTRPSRHTLSHNFLTPHKTLTPHPHTTPSRYTLSPNTPYLLSHHQNYN